MKYSKRDRALSIRICQIAAMTPGFRDSYDPIARALGIASLRRSHPALGLALEAWNACDDKIRNGYGGPLDAEAECLLRDGWSPGDPVVRLGGKS